jgi:hypothetical protein
MTTESNQERGKHKKFRQFVDCPRCGYTDFLPANSTRNKRDPGVRGLWHGGRDRTILYRASRRSHPHLRQPRSLRQSPDNIEPDN